MRWNSINSYTVPLPSLPLLIIKSRRLCQMARLPDQRIHQKTTQSPTHHRGQCYDRGHKLELFGHICRMPDNRMLKRVLFGAVEGRNYQGRPRKRWVDDILKCCDMTLKQASHHAQDHTMWRNIIAEHHGTRRRRSLCLSGASDICRQIRL